MRNPFFTSRDAKYRVSTALAAILFILFALATHAQTLTIKLTSKSFPVAYAMLSDSSYKLARVTNETGTCVLPASAYCLSVSHVSFRDTVVCVPDNSSDAVVEIELEPKEIFLENFTVAGTKRRKQPRGKIYEMGNFKSTSASRFPFNLNRRVCMKFANPSPGRPVFLDNVQFRLFDTKGLNNEDALLQIKFYKLKNGNIEGETINSIPVNVPLSSLKKNNTIKIEEHLEIPQSGLLVCFLLPELSDGVDPNTVIKFRMNVDAADCNLYVSQAYQSFSKKAVNLGKCMDQRNPFFKGYAQLLIGIGYYY